jgi:protein-S-isoprenylcysteine O-methyltransferase Ste14
MPEAAIVRGRAMTATQFAWLILGIVTGAYWVCVLAMALKVRRSSGRAANFIPAERLGRWLRIIWTPIVGIWIANPFYAALARRPIWELSPIGRNAGWVSAGLASVGCGLAACCFIATIFCWKTMGHSWRMGIDPEERTELVSRGPYAYLAHPIYALSQLMMLGTMLSLPSPIILVAGAVQLLLLHWEARREERHMIAVHGEVYERYRSQVGGFIPKFSGRW